MVEKIISSNEAKQRWGMVMETVAEPDGAVVVESRGKPKAAVISYERFAELKRFERQRKNEQRLRRIRELEATYDGRNDHMTEDELTELAVRASKEMGLDLLTQLGLNKRDGSSHE